MKDVFISYAREDSDTAGKLSHALEQEGFSVWWDREISPGKTFHQVIKEQLDHSQCVIVLWSRASVVSDWVLDEASEGHSQRKLVPVLMDDVQIPMGFRRIQAADLRNWNGKQSDPAFQSLTQSVKRMLTPKRPDEPAVTGPPPKSIQPKETPKRANAAWLTNLLVIGALGFFYLAAVFGACSNHDIMALSALIGFPLSLFLILQKQAFRIAWIVLPLISFFIGMPYGHNYGSMTKSALFGLDQGTNCQPRPAVLMMLGIVALAAVIDHVVFSYAKRRR